MIYVIGHRHPDTDSICSAIAYAYLKNHLGDPDVRPARAGPLNAETAFVLRTFAVPTPELLTDAAGLRLILVDHNEVGQALPHIDQAEILEIWEHHRIGDLPISKPIFFHCEPVGATATLIAEQYVEHDGAPPPVMASLMLAAILSDTVVFRSPTVTEKDRAVASHLARIAGLDPTALGEAMLAVKISSTELQTPRELVRRDFKEFLIGHHRVGIAQVEVAHPETILGQRAEVMREMHALLESRQLDQMLLMITDVEARGSELWFVGQDPELIDHAFGPLQAGSIQLPGIMSRKKQIVPRLVATYLPEDASHAHPVAEAQAPAPAIG